MKDSGERLQKGKEGFLIPSTVWSWAGLLPGSGKLVENIRGISAWVLGLSLLRPPGLPSPSCCILQHRGGSTAVQSRNSKCFHGGRRVLITCCRTRPSEAGFLAGRMMSGLNSEW